jgi:hypothetical protein
VLVCGCHAPDGVPDVISDQEGAGFVDGHPDRPAARFAARIEESRDDILGLAVRTPFGDSLKILPKGYSASVPSLSPLLRVGNRPFCLTAERAMCG